MKNYLIALLVIVPFLTFGFVFDFEVCHPDYYPDRPEPISPLAEIGGVKLKDISKVMLVSVNNGQPIFQNGTCTFGENDIQFSTDDTAHFDPVDKEGSSPWGDSSLKGGGGRGQFHSKDFKLSKGKDYYVVAQDSVGAKYISNKMRVEDVYGEDVLIPVCNVILTEDGLVEQKIEDKTFVGHTSWRPRYYLDDHENKVQIPYYGMVNDFGWEHAVSGVVPEPSALVCFFLASCLMLSRRKVRID